MKKLNLALTWIAVASFILLVTSCNKDEDIQTEDMSSSKDNAYAEATFENLGDIADEAYDMSTGHLKSSEINRIFLSDCATVTLDTTVFPYELTIDFGDTNCLCNDGKYRRGKIIISFTGRYRHEGTVITTGFEDYYVDDNKVEGTRVVTNMGMNADSNYYFTIEVVGVITYANNGGTVSWSSSREREWIQGYYTGNRWDDIYLITGTAHGVRPAGDTWDTEIINPLRVELACRFIVSGTVEITPENRPVRLLDYGNGDCDNIATVLVNGVTYTIYLGGN
jgi:hypothetical protein